MINLKNYASKTDQGPYLQLNEDNVEVDLVNNLYLILDGFGGSNVGDNAVRVVTDTIKNFYTRIGGDPDSTLPFYYSPKYLLEGNALMNAMEYAHLLLKKENKNKEMNNRGGASAIALAAADNILTFASTGNCMGLLYSQGQLMLVSQPDNFKYISGDYFDNIYTTAPMSGFGLFDKLHVSISEVRINDGDKVLLLTDGVYARVKLQEINDIMQKDDSKNKMKIDRLFELANDRGNMDNQSALLLSF